MGRNVAIAMLLSALSWNAQAASLNLTLNDVPDIASGFIAVTYAAATGQLSASGFALTIDTGTQQNISGGLFTLDATVDGSGALQSGSFTITGTVAGLGFNSGTLLTGTLTAFGFPDAGGDPLEFRYTTTGGDAAALFGALGGIILSDTGFTGSWSSGFSNNGTGVADTAAVPVPAAVWLMLSGLIGLGSMMRRHA